MKASNKQLAVLNLKSVKQHLVSLVGAFRSGKTLFGAFGFAELMIHQQKHTKIYEGNRYAVVGHANVTATYKNVVVRMIEYLKIRGYTVTKTGMFDFEVVSEHGTFFIETFSVNNVRSYEKLQAGTYRSIFIDEAPLMSNSSIENIVGRCATFQDWKVVMTGNPEGNDSHPYYETYLSGNKDVLYVHFTMLDNPINKQETIDYFKKVFTKTMYQQKVMGQWVAVEGMVYPKVMEERERPDKFEFIFVGLDYGESDATTCVAVGVKDDIYYIFDQYYHKNGEGKNLTLLDYKTEIAEWVNKIDDDNNCQVTMYIETAPTTVFTTFTRDTEIQESISIKKVNKAKENTKSKSAIQERIDITNMLINMGNLFITDKTLPVYKAFKNAMYKNGIRLDNGSLDIDSLDAFEYAIKDDMGYILRNIYKER